MIGRWLLPAVFGMGLLLTACLPDCAVEKRNVVLSPSGKTAAVVFGTDCGATTGFNTQLSVLLSDVAFDRDKYPPVLVLKDKKELGLRWISDVALAVAIPEGAYEYKRLGTSGDVTVTYQNGNKD